MSSSTKQHHSFYQPRHATGKWKGAETPKKDDGSLYDVGMSRQTDSQQQLNPLYEVGNGR